MAGPFAHSLYWFEFDVEVFVLLTHTFLLPTDVSLLKKMRCCNEYAYNAFGKCADINQLLSRLGGGQNRGCDEEPVPELHVGECLTGFGIQKDARDVRRHRLIYDSKNEWPHRHDS